MAFDNADFASSAVISLTVTLAITERSNKSITHLGLEDATDELKRMEDLENARKELDKTSGKKNGNTEDV